MWLQQSNILFLNHSPLLCKEVLRIADIFAGTGRRESGVEEVQAAPEEAARSGEKPGGGRSKLHLLTHKENR